MKCFRSTTCLVLTVLALLALARPAEAGEQVPLRGSLDGSFTAALISTPPPIVAIHLTATGNASHLGRYTFDFPHIVNRGTGMGAGSGEFTAANGDKIFVDIVGQSAPTATPGILMVVEVATITGGTGRFEGATGSIVFERVINQLTLETTGAFAGTISSPGAAKH